MYLFVFFLQMQIYTLDITCIDTENEMFISFRKQGIDLNFSTEGQYNLLSLHFYLLLTQNWLINKMY